MKKLMFSILAIAFTPAAFAHNNPNQVVADAIAHNAEIQEVIKAIAQARHLECVSPGDEEVTLRKGAIFIADFSCNSATQLIEVRGKVHGLNEQGNVTVELTSLSI